MVTAVLSLTLGIGATTAIFSVIYGVLLDPYPYKDADRMVHVQMRGKNQTDFRGPLLFVNGTGYLELKQMSTVDDVFLQQEEPENLTGDQIPITANVGRFSPNLFDYLCVPPVIGREFTPADAPNGNPAPVAVLSYLSWRRQFGGSRDIVGKRLELDHRLYTVIGRCAASLHVGRCRCLSPRHAHSRSPRLLDVFCDAEPGAKSHAAIVAAAGYGSPLIVKTVSRRSEFQWLCVTWNEDESPKTTRELRQESLSPNEQEIPLAV